MSVTIKDVAREFFDMFFKYGMYGYYEVQANADATAKLCREGCSLSSLSRQR